MKKEKKRYFLVEYYDSIRSKTVSTYEEVLEFHCARALRRSDWLARVLYEQNCTWGFSDSLLLDRNPRISCIYRVDRMAFQGRS